jgi:hypothetical protein
MGMFHIINPKPETRNYYNEIIRRKKNRQRHQN